MTVWENNTTPPILICVQILPHVNSFLLVFSLHVEDLFCATYNTNLRELDATQPIPNCHSSWRKLLCVFCFLLVFSFHVLKSSPACLCAMCNMKADKSLIAWYVSLLDMHDDIRFDFCKQGTILFAQIAKERRGQCPVKSFLQIALSWGKVLYNTGRFNFCFLLSFPWAIFRQHRPLID